MNFVLDLGEFAEEDDSIAKLKNAVEYGDEESCNAQVHIMPFYSCSSRDLCPHGGEQGTRNARAYIMPVSLQAMGTVACKHCFYISPLIGLMRP